MARINKNLIFVKSHLAQLVSPEIIKKICVKIGHAWRERKLNPVNTVHLLLLQLLAGVSMTGLAHVSSIKVSAAALCKSRKRLPLEVWQQLVEWSGRLESDCPSSLWKGRFRPMLVDGTTFITPDTPQLSRRYGKSGNQHVKDTGCPMVKLLALLDWSSGVICKVIAIPCARQEQTVLSRMLSVLGGNDLLLGDRGLVSFAHLCLIMGAGIQGCFRLPKSMVTHERQGKVRRILKCLGKGDRLVQWSKPQYSRPHWLSLSRWRALPDGITVRQIEFTLKRKGFRSQRIWIVTTLTCPKAYPAKDIIELYMCRWQVEVDFRDIKTGLGMNRFSAQTFDGVRKEILAFVLLYNLVRRVMLQAAQQQKVDPQRISFTDAVTWLLWAKPGDPLPPLKVNPKRRRPTQPRAVKHLVRRFPILRQPRDTLQLPAAMTVL